MARLPRLHLPGWPVHLVVRGNNRQDIFRSDGDRTFFHRCLVEVTQRHQVSIHAYVFMTNHVHLLVSTGRAEALATAIQSMGRRYVSYFNYLYKRTGTLWEGRYRSCLVETDRYLLACSRYIEMNPVRAGIVQTPGEYLWSSHRFNAFGHADDLLTPHEVYLGLARDPSACAAAYRALFEHELGTCEISSIRAALNKGWALGRAGFCDEVERLSGRRSTPGKRGRPPKSRTAEN
jgi:putative transposase